MVAKNLTYLWLSATSDEKATETSIATIRKILEQNPWLQKLSLSYNLEKDGSLSVTTKNDNYTVKLNVKNDNEIDYQVNQTGYSKSGRTTLQRIKRVLIVVWL